MLCDTRLVEDEDVGEADEDENEDVGDVNDDEDEDWEEDAL